MGCKSFILMSIVTKLVCKNFKLVKDILKFEESFMKCYFLAVDVQYPEKLHGDHNYLPFLPERLKIEKVEKLQIKLNMLFP